MTPETVLRNKLTKYLRSLKAEGEPIWWVKLHGGPMQRAGVPDFLIVYRGVPLFVELKAPGNKPTKLQTHTLIELAKAGAWTVVASGLAEVVEMIARIKTLP